MSIFILKSFLGELALHRLNWQRVWLLSPHEEGEKISNIAWRPDGKIIAISYSHSKLLCLVDIENKNIVHKTRLKTDEHCTCIAWLSLTPSGCGSSNCSSNSSTASNGEKTCLSCTGDYLPPLPNLSRSFGQEPERKEFLSQTLDMLFVSDQNALKNKKEI